MDFTEDFEEYKEESSDDCEDLDRFLVPKLPVANFDHFDPNQPPVTGEEYLRRVQIEAQNCPEIVVADLDINKFKSNQTVIIENTNGFIVCKPELRPSIEWQRLQVSEFTKVRLKIARMKDLRIKAGVNGDRTLVRNRSIDWWKEFCIGRKSTECDSDSCSGSLCESDLSTPTDTPDNKESSLRHQKLSKPEPNLPLLSFLCDMTQEEVILVLSYHIKWIHQFGFKEQNGVWIYSLLVILEKPLSSEVYSTLRELSRICSEFRHKIESSNDNLVLIALNLIICLIGRYFDQNDMIDQ